MNPGDRVDIFGYFKEGRGIPSTGTREILKNVRVFAVNDQTDQEIDQEGRTIVAKTVSVLVKQDQVAKLMLATELGTLRLALRRPNETVDDGNRGETATVESLFGTRSETADGSPAADTGQPTGFGHRWFRRFPERSEEPDRSCGRGGTVAVDPQPPPPAWQMTLLTPDGRHAVHLERRTRLAGDGRHVDRPAPGSTTTRRAPTACGIRRRHAGIAAAGPVTRLIQTAEPTDSGRRPAERAIRITRRTSPPNGGINHRSR